MQFLIRHMLTSARDRLRRALRGPALLAALLLGLLLIQPTLCVLHCALDAHGSHHAHGSGQHLLCSLADEETAHSAHIPVPAFWPSLPGLLLLGLTLAAVATDLPLFTPSRPRSLRWSPPSPPPRPITDSR